MLPKNVNSTRRARVAQNSPVLNIQKPKNGGTQTTNLGFLEGSTVISDDGTISKNDQNNYKKAIDFVNEWNNAMDEYLNKRSSIKKDECGEYSDFHGNLHLGQLPNYMAFFLAIQEVDSRCIDVKKPLKKNSYTQTKNSQERIVVDVKSQTHYVKFSEEVIEDANGVENIPKKIQQAQYSTYPQKTSKILQNSNHCPPLRRSARFSESNIRQTSSRSSNPVKSHLEVYNSKISNPINPRESPQNSPLRQNQSFGSFNSASSGVGRRKRPLTGLLSPNGMIASEINANGTPIIVRDMFEKVQNPLGVFVSQGNILRNISRNDSSSSSVILSDKDSEEVKIQDGEERDDVERTSSPYDDEGQCGREGFDHRGTSSGCEEEDLPTKHHPLNLNERDLNSKDRNFITSIGIYTEAGELKPNAKTYLERKEDVRRGPFRTPRLSQLHMTQHYNVKSCDSESLLSDLVSTRSSEFYE